MSFEKVTVFAMKPRDAFIDLQIFLHKKADFLKRRF